MGLDGQGRQGTPRPNRRWIAILAMDLERPHLPRSRLRRTRWPAQRQRRCLGCLLPLTNGAIVCCPECDELWWRVVPTITGDLWERVLCPTWPAASAERR
jgi:hypothetical protein